MSYWNNPLIIKNRPYPRFVGAPLDGITDSPFRKLVRKFSKNNLLFSEMRHVACVASEKGGERALDFSQIERPFHYQISAHSLDFVERACEKIIASQVDGFDLNIGCPARLVVNSGAGSALMGDLPRLKRILELLRKSVSIPFTVKMRAGFKIKNAVEVASLIQDCGIDALTIHPRLQTQQFTGVPDYKLVAEVKRSVSIPVIVSGGIVNWATAKSVYEQTNVDGFLIGRAIWSRPWKLFELEEASQGRSYIPSQNVILECALEHLDLMMSYYGERGLYAFRKHLPFYIKGRPIASQIRAHLVTSQSVDEIKEGLKSFFESP